MAMGNPTEMDDQPMGFSNVFPLSRGILLTHQIFVGYNALAHVHLGLPGMDLEDF